MNNAAKVMLQMEKQFHREMQKAKEKGLHYLEPPKEALHDYIIGTKQVYCSGPLLVRFKTPQYTEYTLDDVKFPHLDYMDLLKRARKNSLEIVPPCVEVLKNLKRQFGKHTRIAFYLGDKEISVNCPEFIVFSADLLIKVLEMVPCANSMWLSQNDLTDESTKFYGMAYFKNKFGDEGLLAPMRSSGFEAILMQNNKPLWTFADYLRFEKGVEQK